MSKEEKELLSIQKNPDEQIRIIYSIYQEQPYINLRVYYKDKNDDYHATKKGVTFSAYLLEEIIEALKNAEKLFSGEE